MLWFHTPCIMIVHGASNGPQNDIGNYLGPCSIEPKLPQVGPTQTPFKGSWGSWLAHKVFFINSGTPT